MLCLRVIFMMHIILAENIPRTLRSVYMRARRLFDPKFAAEE